MTEPYCGEIRLFAGNYIPESWQACDGSILSASDWPQLCQLLGATYGGDGSSTFGVPNLCGQVPLAIGNSPTSTTVYALGDDGGASSVNITPSTMPNHTHSYSASTASATTADPVLMLYADLEAPAENMIPFATTQLTVSLNPGALGSVGGNAPHENRMPSTVINYIIALQGIQPDPATLGS